MAGEPPPSFQGMNFGKAFKAESLKAGQSVLLQHLESRPELNGLLGIVRSYSKDKDRYGVELDAASNARLPSAAEQIDQRLLSLKRSNLQIIADVESFIKQRTKGKKRFTDAEVQAMDFDEFQKYLNEDSSESESASESDGSLCDEKRQRNERMEMKRKAKQTQKFGRPGGPCNVIDDSGLLDSKNPAYDYPKTGTRPVLVIGGCGMSDDDDGSCFTSNKILSTQSALWQLWGCRFLSFKHGGSAKAASKIVEAIESRQYNVILVPDLSVSEALDAFATELGPSLKDFVEKFGGSLALVTTEGGLLSDHVLKPLWPSLGWRADSYYRATHSAVQANRANVSRLFPGCEDLKYSVKGMMLSNVPVEERFFATSQDARMFRYLANDYDPAQDFDEDRTRAIVAVKQFEAVPVADGEMSTGHGGKLAFFSDVNAEDQTAMLCLKFLDTAG